MEGETKERREGYDGKREENKGSLIKVKGQKRNIGYEQIESKKGRERGWKKQKIK